MRCETHRGHYFVDCTNGVDTHRRLSHVEMTLWAKKIVSLVTLLEPMITDTIVSSLLARQPYITHRIVSISTVAQPRSPAACHPRLQYLKSM